MHTIDTIETNPEIKEMNMSPRQLTDHLLDCYNATEIDEEKEAILEQLKSINPKRS